MNESDEMYTDCPLGQRGLEEYSREMASNTASIEGQLAVDFDCEELLALFSDAPSEVAKLGKPSRGAKEIACRVAVSEQEMAYGLSKFPSPLDWSYEQGLIRDPIARDANGAVLWRIDSDTGVVTLERSRKRLTAYEADSAR